MLNQISCSIVRNQDDSNDIINNAMLSLFSLIPKLRGMGERERLAYVCSTVRHEAYKHYKENRCKNLTEFFPGNDFLFSLPSKDDNPSDLLLKNEDFRIVREAIAALPEKERRLLYLKYAVRLTAYEIAELTSASSEAAVHERLSRTRRKVLESLKKKGWPYE